MAVSTKAASWKTGRVEKGPSPGPMGGYLMTEIVMSAPDTKGVDALRPETRSYSGQWENGRQHGVGVFVDNRSRHRRVDGMSLISW